MSNLTASQRQALDLIKREQRVTSRRLAAETGTRAQDAGRTLTALQRKGLVRFVYQGTDYVNGVRAGYELV